MVRIPLVDMFGIEIKAAFHQILNFFSSNYFVLVFLDRRIDVKNKFEIYTSQTSDFLWQTRIWKVNVSFSFTTC
jgi:hypothetical protein